VVSVPVLLGPGCADPLSAANTGNLVTFAAADIHNTAAEKNNMSTFLNFSIKGTTFVRFSLETIL
jgi:hypothetical protein